MYKLDFMYIVLCVHFQVIGRLNRIIYTAAQYQGLFSFPFFNIVQSEVLDDVSSSATTGLTVIVNCDSGRLNFIDLCDVLKKLSKHCAVCMGIV